MDLVARAATGDGAKRGGGKNNRKRKIGNTLSSDTDKSGAKEAKKKGLSDDIRDDPKAEARAKKPKPKPLKSLKTSDPTNHNVDVVLEEQHKDNDEGKRRHQFATVALDHCETPVVAYEHLKSFLEKLSTTALKVRPYTHLRIWDPFYCDGSTKRIFLQMGFNIIHQNVDFYEIIREEPTIPRYDVLVTNPPYSGDHIDRLLAFVVSQLEQESTKKCCCLLLPNWVARKQDYTERFTNPLDKAGHELFYLSPLVPYTYNMPLWVTNDDRPEHVDGSGQTTPYLSSWYMVVPSSLKMGAGAGKSFLDGMDAVARKQKSPVWVVAKTIRGLKWKLQKLQKHKKKNNTKKR